MAECFLTTLHPRQTLASVRAKALRFFVGLLVATTFVPARATAATNVIMVGNEQQLFRDQPMRKLVKVRGERFC